MVELVERSAVDTDLLVVDFVADLLADLALPSEPASAACSEQEGR